LSENSFLIRVKKAKKLALDSNLTFSARL